MKKGNRKNVKNAKNVGMFKEKVKAVILLAKSGASGDAFSRNGSC